MRPDEHMDALRQAAQLARSRWLRVVGHGDGSSWLDQMEAGDVPADWPADHAAGITEMLVVLGEQARHARAMGGLTDGTVSQPDAGSAFIAATRQRLPMNRKERYYTGTVLPAMISENGFVHLHRFLALCGLDVNVQLPDSNALDGRQDVEFFTEYSFAESVHTAEDKSRFSDRPAERDTPDIVISGPDWLLVVEAKMYHRPTTDALHEQMSRQRTIVDYWTRKLALDPARVAHVLLLPQALADARAELDVPVVTWEQVLEQYGTVGAPYWLGVLRSADQPLRRAGLCRAHVPGQRRHGHDRQRDPRGARSRHAAVRVGRPFRRAERQGSRRRPDDRRLAQPGVRGAR